MRRLVVLIAMVLALPLVGVVMQAPAQAAACQSLSADDIKVDSPHLTGSFAAKNEQACYVFSAPVGTGMQFSWASGSYTLPDNFIGVSVTNATGGVVCSVRENSSDVCRLTGLPPYRVTVTHSHTSFSEYDFQMFRLTGDPDDTGCTDAVTAPFGSGALYETEIAPASFDCWTYQLQPGYKFVRWTGMTHWRLTGPNGDTVCDQPPIDLTDCRVPAAGRYTLLARPWEEATVPWDESVALVDLAGHEGCHGPVSTAWDVAPLVQLMSGPFQVDCWPFEADAGDRVVPQAGPTGGWGWRSITSVVDAEGRRVCSNVPSTALGCTLQGSPPYRLLTWRTPWESDPLQDYKVAVRSLSPAVGCPEITPTPYGTLATPVQGLQCRHFFAEAGDNFDITGGNVFGEDFEVPCDQLARTCTTRTSGRFWVFGSRFDSASSVNLHDRASTQGCETTLPLDLTVRTRVAGPPTVACLTLAGMPGDEVTLFVPEDESRDGEPVVVNGAGELICDNYNVDVSGRIDDCVLTGTAPFRAILGPLQSVDVAAIRRNGPPGCAELGAGGLRTIELNGGQRSTCFTVSGVPHSGTTLKLARQSATGAAVMAQTLSKLRCGDSMEFASSVTLTCGLDYEGPRRSTFVVFGNGEPATYRLSRTDGPPDPEPDLDEIINVTRPRITGDPVVGRRVHVRPGTWNVVPTRYHYAWFVGDRRLKTTKASLRLKPGMAGKRVKVYVAATLFSYEPGLAVSRAVRVRRD